MDVWSPEVNEVPEVAGVAGGIRGSLVPIEPVQSRVVAICVVVASLQADADQLWYWLLYAWQRVVWLATRRRTTTCGQVAPGQNFKINERHRNIMKSVIVPPWSGRTRRP